MEIIDLTGNWQCFSSDRTTSIPAHVPGCIHQDLLREKQIPDLNWRDNEYRAHWVSEKTWCYQKEFNISEHLLQETHLLLTCEGLDTLAEIYINHQLVAKTNNMFRTWNFEVKSFLKTGKNFIEIHFSPLFATMEKYQKEEKVLPTWNIFDSRTAGRSWIRKMPCNFGWDWGLVAITCGIWKPIRIKAFSSPRIDSFYIRQSHNNQQVTLTFSAKISTLPSALMGQIEIIHPNGFCQKITYPISNISTSHSVKIENPQLWWPHGLGKQPLYQIHFSLYQDNNLVDYKSLRIGLRTIKLDRHSDQWGETFQFIINGLPFFAKGANWIPADIFVSRLTKEDYRQNLTHAIFANMNMLRVWGGGIYESDEFYDLCDEMGILVWQEFIFACSSYPTFNHEFMDNVRHEAVDNIKRLRHHASLALWCGNNEIEQGIVDDEWNDLSMSWQDYAKLFEDLLPNLVTQYDPEHDYWIGSPHTPYGDRKDFNNPTCGDAHCWDVWFGGQNFEYQRTWLHRFMSEFGFQSFPELKTIKTFTLSEDRNLTSYIMDYHQRSPNGNRKIFAYILDWFRFPKNFEETLWLTQITQAVAIQYACEHARRIQPRMMGTLYWQMNDLWPCASWSSVDCFHRWKALHYLARRFYAPLQLSIVENLENHTMTIYISNQTCSSQEMTCYWYATDLSGHELFSDTQSVCISAQTQQTLPSIICSQAQLGKILTATELFSPPTEAERQFLFWAELKVNGEVVSRNTQFFTKPKYLNLQDPQISVVIQQSNEQISLVITANRPALFVRLEIIDTDVIFSDNFFHLNGKDPITITFLQSPNLTCEEIKDRLQIHSLIDSYQ